MKRVHFIGGISGNVAIDSGEKKIRFSQLKRDYNYPSTTNTSGGDILRDYQLSKSTKILHISNGYLKPTSGTPGLSNPYKL